MRMILASAGARQRPADPQDAGRPRAPGHDVTGKNAMAVLREWRAEIRRALKDEYVQYVKATGLAAYLRTPGNLGAAGQCAI